MDEARWQRIQSVFHEAAELPAGERDVFVKLACGSDGALCAEVTAMLSEDARGASLLDRGLAEAAHQVAGAAGPVAFLAQEFGPYRVTQLIGEGGMGVVYLAERADLGSLVAIKLLRDAWLSPARRERFLSEQRTLAQMNHAAIARLYDADTLPDGTPWFVMEYVDGRPLTEYCWQRRSSIRERLQLFRAVCEAVQYAHGQAIIHRDLKPSNILVKADGAPKLLDFGIAKQLDGPDEAADQTRTGLRLMTPAYAAPEQIRGERVGVYTDVYSLGVILYELLAGRLPFDLSTRTPGEAERMIMEREPDRPSAARALPATRAAWADLDVLCLTAMHKDPARRYRSAEALMRDVDHYLRGEPLEARPDSVRYRARKFMARNRRAVTAAAAVIIVVTGLVVFFTVRLAIARNGALAQSARAQRIQQFMLNLFDGGDSSAGPADTLPAVTLVDRGVQQARALDREPAVQAELYQTLGNIYQKLGKLERADALLSLALQRRRAIFGSEHSEVAESLVALGALRVDQAHLADAEKLVREGLAMSRRTFKAGDPALARAQTALGRVQEHRGDYAQAVATLEEAVRMQSGPNASLPDLAASLSELANTQFYEGKYAISESLNRRALAMHEQVYGGRHPLIADDLLNLAAIQNNLGHYAEAEAFDRRALDINRSWYGNDHPETGASLNYLGQALVNQNRFDEAEDLLQQSLAIQERVYGPVHQRVAVALNELGMLEQRRGKLDDAEARFRRAVEIDRAVYGDHHQSVALESANLATVYLEKKEYSRAEDLFRAVLKQYREMLPPGHLNIAIAEIKLGRTLARERRYQEAEAHMLAGYQTISKQAKPSVSWLQRARKDLVGLYEASGHPEKAAAFRE
jgi:serine/threonine-protein kinase